MAILLYVQASKDKPGCVHRKQVSRRQFLPVNV